MAVRSGTTFRFVSAHFFVPYLDCTGVSASNPAYSSHWVGLDGFVTGSRSVEQTGLLAACYPGKNNTATPTYEPWYEKYPNAPVYPSMTVHPGDAITASIYYNSSTKVYTFALADGTNGQHFSVPAKCPVAVTCARSSAEAISEAPSDGTNVLPLADFQAASFAGVTVTNSTGKETGGFVSPYWDDYKIRQVSDGTNLDAGGAVIPAGTPLDTPTPLLLSGTAFDAYWMPGT